MERRCASAGTQSMDVSFRGPAAGEGLRRAPLEHPDGIRDNRRLEPLICPLVYDTFERTYRRVKHHGRARIRWKGFARKVEPSFRASKILTLISKPRRIEPAGFGLRARMPGACRM
jgi:hypothetical protein